MPLVQAAQNVVPVAVTAGDKIEALRQWPAMNILARLSLFVVALLMSVFTFGLAFVRADELPKDTNTIESLTPVQARKLAEKLRRSSEDLNGLTTLSPEAAKAIAGLFVAAGSTVASVADRASHRPKAVASQGLVPARAATSLRGRDFVHPSRRFRALILDTKNPAYRAVAAVRSEASGY